MKNLKNNQEAIMTADDFEAKMDGRNEPTPPAWRIDQPIKKPKDLENEKIIEEE